MFGLMVAADDAEARGDVSAALDIIDSQPWDEDGRLFWRPSRILRLEQLLLLDGLVPRWAVSRWILEQALQAHQPQLRSARERALDIAVELRGGRSALPGRDGTDKVSRVMDNDWVYRQLYLYELGGLVGFLRRHASADLVVGADRIREWADARMRALRFVSREDTVLHWEDLGTMESVDTPNLGAAAMVLPGECVIGRLVPSDLGEIFENVPLRVDEPVAEQVAHDPAGWLDVLRDVGTGGDSRTAIVRGSHVFSDVPETVWQFTLVGYAGDPTGPVTPATLVDAVIETVRAAMSGRLEADVDEDGVDPWPCLAVALIHPLVIERLPAAFGPSDAVALDAMARRLVGPAGDVCRELAEFRRAA